jgi:LysR family transcriptional activator of nhaA
VLNYSHLFYFYSIARFGSLSEAAKHLHLSQPALSIQIKTLELRLDRKLFRKEGRKLRLTTDGERIFHYCQKAFETMESLESYLGSADPAENKISFGVCDEVDRTFATDLIKEVIDLGQFEFPVHVTLLTFPHSALFAKSEVDLILTTREAASTEFNLVGELFMPVALVCSPGILPADYDPSTSLSELLDQFGKGLVLATNGSSLRFEIERYMAANQIAFPTAFESNTTTSIRSALVSGFGPGFMPLPYVQTDITNGLLVKLSSELPLWNHRLFIYSKRQSSKNSLGISLADLIHREFGSIKFEAV